MDDGSASDRVDRSAKRFARAENPDCGRRKKTPEEIAIARADRKARKAAKKAGAKERLALIEAIVEDPEHVADERLPVKAEIRQEQWAADKIKRVNIDERVKVLIDQARERRLIAIVAGIEAKGLENGANDSPKVNTDADAVEHARFRVAAQDGTMPWMGNSWHSLNRDEMPYRTREERRAERKAAKIAVAADASPITSKQERDRPGRCLPPTHGPRR